MLFYPWPWQPQDIHQVSKSDICHGTMANHHLTLSRQSNNNKREQISTRSIKGEQWHQQEYQSWNLNMDPHFSHAPPLDRRDLLLFGEVIDGDQDELMTIGRLWRNLPDDVDIP